MRAGHEARRHEGHVVGGAVRVESTEKPILTSPSPGPPHRDTAKEAAMSQAQESEVFEPEGFMDSDVSANPQPYYRRAQAEGSVVPGTFGPQVVRRSAVEYVLQHPEEFSSAMQDVDLGQSVPLIPLQVDPPNHRNYRRLLDPIFAPRQMNLLEPDIARLVNERIDGFIDTGRCEFSDELAVPLPSAVFLRLVGLPLSQLDLFLSMKDGILRLFLTAEIDGQRLTVDEIVGICFLFILAGLDTVTDSLECFFAYLAQHPDQRRRIVDDPTIIPSTVE